MRKISYSILIGLFFSIGCYPKVYIPPKEPTNTETVLQADRNRASEKAGDNLKTMLTKNEVPILCYHNIRNLRGGESKTAKTYTVSPADFAEQMKALSDSGYHTILPDQLYDYFTHNKPLPKKPVMITFDDTREEHYLLGAVEMEKFGFKGVFFIMTVSINRPGYMSEKQIKNLSDRGHVIAGHTWDHHKVTNYTKVDWERQLVKPQKQLESLTGKPIKYFSYPFGVWDPAAIKELKNHGYKLAFILSSKRDSESPLYTVRRMIVSGGWSGPKMLRVMEATFKE